MKAIPALLLLLLIAACKKDDAVNNASGPIQGTLVADCGGSPVANAGIEFVQPAIDLAWPQDDIPARSITIVTTDATGRFMIDAKMEDAYAKELYYRDASGTRKLLAIGDLSDLPTGSVHNAQLGHLYLNEPTADLILNFVDGGYQFDSVHYETLDYNTYTPRVEATLPMNGADVSDTLIGLPVNWKFFSGDPASADDRKHYVRVFADFYKNGSVTTRNMDFYVNVCGVGYQTLTVQ